MNFGPALAASMLAAASVVFAGPSARPDTAAPIRAVPTAGPAAEAPARLSRQPQAGDPAPDFTYQSQEYLWQNLHNMLEQGSVLLVFGAGDAEMLSIERERDALVRSGVLPVAVVHRRDSEVRSIIRRNDLTYSLLADPRGVIAEQYGVVADNGRDVRLAWFVIDRSRNVRASGEGIPHAQGWAALASTALGHTDTQPAGSR